MSIQPFTTKGFAFSRVGFFKSSSKPPPPLFITSALLMLASMPGVPTTPISNKRALSPLASISSTKNPASWSLVSRVTSSAIVLDIIYFLSGNLRSANSFAVEYTAFSIGILSVEEPVQIPSQEVWLRMYWASTGFSKAAP